MNQMDLPISPIDILYGLRGSVALGNEYMAHKGGFTYSVLNDALLQAGFNMNFGGRRQDRWELFIVSFVQKKSEDEAKKIAITFLSED